MLINYLSNARDKTNPSDKGENLNKEVDFINKKDCDNSRDSILLICKEGGFGTHIWSARLGAFYKDLFPKVSIACPKELVELFRSYGSFDNVYCSSDLIATGPKECNKTISSYYYYDVLPNENDINRIGALDVFRNPDYQFKYNMLHNEEAQILERLGCKSSNNILLIGVCWKAGGPEKCRRMLLDDLIAFTENLSSNFRLVSLQKGKSANDERKKSKLSNLFVEDQDSRQQYELCIHS